VKSGASGAMKSLHQFMFEKKLKTALRFDTNNLSRLEVKVKTTQGDPVQYTLLSAPVYRRANIRIIAAQASRLISKHWNGLRCGLLHFSKGWKKYLQGL